MYRVMLATGFAVGYVLGSRAGRQRYEQLARAGQRVKDHPTVQTAAGVIGAQATDLVTKARGKAKGALHIGSETPAYAGRSQANGAMP
ncbi:MAG TPA: hypothetical protein VLJ59_07500 [Mycobacteriales bacterium]|nr:hypothetical protein [Mycobacteriales bacterium]